MKQVDLLYSGKAKSVYRTDDPGVYIMKFRDDITAFDGGKKDTLGGKGRYNAEVSSFFFRYLEENGIKTHYLSSVDPTAIAVRSLTMIPLEVIVRNVAAGSIVRNYPFREGEVLDPAVIVIDYKSDAHHDPMLNDDLIYALGLATPEELDQIKAMALAVNIVLSEYLAARGITLVDFKLEFGKTDGEIVVGDEISMDSMRLWDKETGASLDKDVYRFNKGDVMETYAGVAKRILSPPGEESA
ncbi:MAG: Phosphoribosylaminoimidazole-succinocarboxamide synthase [Euryarchaeota archaeon ADurb.Bin009]|jgi:phosphoribosylaminoimidazole-succinocarboxamide synthase|uniref:phosphoribosylaminoimidazolesuccinocarboxamide synthase n=1 Tax=Methanoculleus sp. TaxID=90427 RepID=UPI0009D066D1|nr:phosphoribosylaminoimidazolesuccinocarboxamide synthase [Methanoculleus sp.]OQC69956.1 MAG: Phosphoribosylaminoimidazole-succinocarboxamide synthase [Euryarchaeota archaeon ADurb.Bin009]HNT08074.1 phosphoribosylaminoimidazolesuccinocarboxamide synthase [Methanoculleus sp.]HOC84359.1 phosphoribosylaminoimidazolesuccinocarboxamide synthase [Methanoculleus sp.]HOF96200.1 phosphoribosylaminoimidazolesuccinocarboxamide synthase [Methanoculleus sp.]HOI61891.1 phosphoribosylaminoimidazolesuccinoca